MGRNSEKENGRAACSSSDTRIEHFRVHRVASSAGMSRYALHQGFHRDMRSRPDGGVPQPQRPAEPKTVAIRNSFAVALHSLPTPGHQSEALATCPFAKINLSGVTSIGCSAIVPFVQVGTAERAALTS